MKKKTVFIIFLSGSFYKTFLNKISAEIEVNREASAEVTPFFCVNYAEKKVLSDWRKVERENGFKKLKRIV
jgi:hypothetical protein